MQILRAGESLMTLESLDEPQCIPVPKDQFDTFYQSDQTSTGCELGSWLLGIGADL